MPEVYIYAIEGRTLDQKRKLVKEVTEAVARNLDVAEDAVLIQLLEFVTRGEGKRWRAFQRSRRACEAMIVGKTGADESRQRGWLSSPH